MKKPKNRTAELLAYFIENRNVFMSYNDISFALYNNNVHRYRDFLEDLDIEFIKQKISTKNRFGRQIEYKQFMLRTPISKAKKIYEMINK